MKPISRFPPSNRSGVTLIEIMVVVVMIGLVTAFVAPRIDFEHYQVDGGMQAVATTLMAAQREAVAKQHNVAVMFDLTNSSLRILHDTDNDNTIDVNERIRVLTLDTHVLIGRANANPLPQLGAADITFTRMINGLPSVIFHRNGSASQSGGLYLTSVRADAGVVEHQRDTRALELFRATGRPEWYRYDGTNWTRGF
jgi:prepilin-type N-terminal cleavage/methylation domain-containing protein